jgi:serine/threonine protein kinase
LNKPTPFGKYYLIERVNVGGMAEVFKAKVMGVEGFERIVALKRILPHIAEDEEFITMFIDEAKIAVQLQHANIAQIFDLGKVDEAYFIALEYVHGRDMRGIYDDLHRRRQLMPTPQICFVIMQVCEGLDYAHNKRDQQGRALNLVHRDVSPQNILVGFEGEVKLIDFGIAKAAGKASKTQAGILKGKFGYMSPEQVRGLAIDRRSDIFALGIILYEMLTGERLFVGESDFSTLEKVRNVEIIPPSSINSQIPEQLERIVLKALAKDVEDRYQNALDLHDDLQAFLYTTGKFSSRKDLSAWMKRCFPSAAQPEEVVDVNSSVEIQDVDELEDDTEELTPGAQAKAEHRRREQGLGWDDEELETSIYDRPGDGVDSPRPQMGDRTFDSDDKTVAAAPSEAILAEMGEGFSAPSTFAEKAPTHRDERPRFARP